MLINKIVRQTILCSALFAATVMAQTPYDEGQKALREQSWTEAAEQFEQAIKSDKDTADASMYWRAHALYKAGRESEAERQIRSLERKHPDSRWVKEAQVLKIEHGVSASDLTDVTDASGLDEDLRMFALAQLMDRDPERALPLVLDMLQNSDSENVRRDTLFMLGMSEDPRAQEAIAQIARESNNPELQVDAIHMLGIASNQPSLALLSGLYKDSDSIEVKQAVIQAYIVGDEPGPLTEILKSENDPELQTEIIHALGVMDATDELKEIYPKLASQETRVAALEAFSIAGDTEALRQVLDTETEPELRRAAIRGIAMEDDEGAAALLESVYDDASLAEEKQAILEALVMMDDAEDLALSIVRTETDMELQRQAIHMLGVMEATEELAELYVSIANKDLRMAVLQSMMIAEDTDGLMKILQSEQDAQLRSTAMQMLAVSDDAEAARYLVTLYPDGSREEKGAIIQSMMITEDVQGLISLLKTETDPELKREMLQMLSVMDSEESDEYLFELLGEKG